MPKSDDISALYDQFSGNANSFQEIGRTARAAEAHARWPLFSHFAKENGASVPPAGDQIPMAAKPTPQVEPAPRLTAPDTEPPPPVEWLQRLGKMFQPGSRATAPAPFAQHAGTAIPTSPMASLTPPPAIWPENRKSTPTSPESPWQRVSAAPQVAMPFPNSVAPSGLPPVATVQVPSPATASAPVLTTAVSSRVGASPLRRLARVEPSTPRDRASNDPLLAEDLSSVFSRLAGRPAKDPGR